MLTRLWNKLRPIETRSSGGGYTAQVMQARESYISGRSGVAELTATVQSCVSLWEGAFVSAGRDRHRPAEPADHGPHGAIHRSARGSRLAD